MFFTASEGTGFYSLKSIVITKGKLTKINHEATQEFDNDDVPENNSQIQIVMYLTYS